MLASEQHGEPSRRRTGEHGRYRGTQRPSTASERLILSLRARPVLYCHQNLVEGTVVSCLSDLLKISTVTAYRCTAGNTENHFHSHPISVGRVDSSVDSTDSIADRC